MRKRRISPMRALFGLTVAALAACGGGGDDAVVDHDAAVTPDAAVDAPVPDPSDALFPRDHVLDVRITLAPADWNSLRNQQPGPAALTCSGGTGVDTYTYF